MINIFEYIDNPFKKSKKKCTDTKIDLDLDAHEENDMILTDEQIDKIIACAKNISLEMYVFFLVLKYTGCDLEAIRSSLITSTVNERVIGSGVVKDSMKTGKVIYFVPAEIMTEIRGIYSRSMVIGYSPRKEQGSCMSKQSIWFWVQKIIKITGIEFTAYSFRHTIITRRRITGATSI